ncbi:hypothetical protein [Jannaschia sp. CCS1]|uniref:hypothetical protein n=1 Tax=Jannaschia sp. (strain CCS1) TaxID=290400 RepID=UPI000053CD7B|nr:hypothetical protein [Jannaschia sp. CCS1]ABD55425.1 hypothetical protein Jann_2508 [Jannaschia sp. CCS1]
MFRSLLALVVAGQSASAQEVAIAFPLRDVLELATQAHLDASGFEHVLAQALPITSEPTPLPNFQPDPFLWSLTGSFGGGGAHPRAGAIFACARYGLGTRDLFAEHGLTARESFTLMGQARPQFDDASVWPDGAVARLHCSFVWDDARVVAILPEHDTQLALAEVFNTLTALPQTNGTRIIYGEDGYRLDATDGPGDTMVHVESARMTLTLGHQSFTFRSFLMGGGV